MPTITLILSTPTLERDGVGTTTQEQPVIEYVPATYDDGASVDLDYFSLALEAF